jgi:hypothetical protein
LIFFEENQIRSTRANGHARPPIRRRSGHTESRSITILGKVAKVTLDSVATSYQVVSALALVRMFTVKPFSEDVQREPPRIWGCGVESFLRHHLPGAIAKQSVTLVDPKIELARAYTPTSLEGGKTTSNVADH